MRDAILKSQIQSLEVTYFIHATEDQGKVARAVERAVSTPAQSDYEEMQGHFGNKIFRVRYHLVGEDAEEGLGNLLAKMPPQLKRDIRMKLPTMIDEHSALFVRFDKQALVSGRIEEGTTDTVRVKVKPRGHTLRGSAQDFYSDLLGAS